MPTPEQYSPEQNASVKTETMEHNESGHGFDEQNTPDGTIEDINENLESKIEAMRLQKEQDIANKLTERESLIKESNTTETLILTAQANLDYFTTTSELGEITDTKQLEDLKKTLDLLQKKQSDIKARIAIIEKNPDILNILYEASQVEESKQKAMEEARQIHEQTLADLQPEIEKIAMLTNSLWEKDQYYKEEFEKQEKEKSDIYKTRQEIFANAKKQLNDGSAFSYTLENIANTSRTPKEIEENLKTALKSLGWFKNTKEKAIIKSLLDNQKLFEVSREYPDALDEMARSGKEQAERSVIVDDYKKLYLKAMKAEQKINTLTNREHGYGLRSDIFMELDKKLNTNGTTQRMRANLIEVGEEINGIYEKLNS
ncbi:MAG: hypothetical protein AAB870_02000 [Patescibacteria group bacterium]